MNQPMQTVEDDIAAIEEQAVAAERARIKAVVEGTFRLRLTGEQLDDLPDGTNREDFFVDFDEWEEWVPLSILAAILDPRP